MWYNIQQYYAVKISLTDIAASGSVGQSKCCQLFANYIGQTPNVYLTQYRLDKSKKLLKNTDMTITEIAYAVGFNGSSYYAETFRKWYKKSPTEYKNELKKRLLSDYDTFLRTPFKIIYSKEHTIPTFSGLYNDQHDSLENDTCGNQGP